MWICFRQKHLFNRTFSVNKANMTFTLIIITFTVNLFKFATSISLLSIDGLGSYFDKATLEMSYLHIIVTLTVKIKRKVLFQLSITFIIKCLICFIDVHNEFWMTLELNTTLTVKWHCSLRSYFVIYWWSWCIQG